MESLLTVIIPAYNESESLEFFLPKVIEYCDLNNYKLIIVNDGSTDNSKDLLSEFKYDFLNIINHKVNQGYGGAIKSGIKSAASKYVITIDADGQHHLEDIELLLKEIHNHDADMIVGSRKGQLSSSIGRSIGKSIIRFFAKIMMDIPLYDLNSGMKIYNTVLAKSYLKLAPDSMAYSDIIALAFINHKKLVLEKTIQISPRKKGESTIGLHTAFETILAILNIIILFNPLKVFLPISMFFIIIGLSWGSYILFLGRGVSVGASTLIITSVIVFLLGLVAEQLSAIRKNN